MQAPLEDPGRRSDEGKLLALVGVEEGRKRQREGQEKKGYCSEMNFIITSVVSLISFGLKLSFGILRVRN